MHFVGQSLPPADDREANVLLHDLGPLVDQVLVEQGHQEFEFRLRPFPVLRAEAVERELANSEPTALFDGRPYALHAAAMALVTR